MQVSPLATIGSRDTLGLAKEYQLRRRPAVAGLGVVDQVRGLTCSAQG
jgi:hypothetical protein